HVLVNRYPDLLAGCTEAIGEVGGYSYTVSHTGAGQRLYLVQVAEKGLHWLRLVATSRPGHGSMVHEDNAVTALAEAVARIGRHRFPVTLTPPVRAFLELVSAAVGVAFAPHDPEAPVAELGSI